MAWFPHIPSVSRSIPALALGLASCGGPSRDGESSYRAIIRWTSWGIPHIEGDDLASVAFGQGYAFASLRGCLLADQILKVRSERAAFFGPGTANANLDSDFAYLHLGVYQNAVDGLVEQPQAVQQLLAGYAAGFNQFIEDTHIEDTGLELPGDCAGKPWVRPISDVDLLAYYLDLGMLGSSRQLVDSIAVAQPPTVASLSSAAPTKMPRFRSDDMGSNGWAIGGERSASGHGMVVANPHFPWQGELKLYESHLTIPGELDVYGASLMGVVGVLIGFNENVAWTHTVSSSHKMTLYRLDLDPDDPTAYLYDGEARKMEAVEYTIDVLREDGKVETSSRTLYRSHYGPMLDLQPFGWSESTAFTYKDANHNNQKLIEQFLAMNRADSMDSFQQAFEDIAGIPWVNTIAASQGGRTWYADATAVPNLRPEAIAAWESALQNDLITGLVFDSGAVLLDGSDSTFEWIDTPGARDAGLIPFSQAPKLERDDFVFNANDSHWLSHPDELLTGYSPLYGPEDSPRSPRTRMNAQLLLETGSGTPSGDDGKFTRVELQDALLSNRGMMAELLRAAVVERCQGAEPVQLEQTKVDITAACAALAAWNGKVDADSKGAFVWREFLADFDARDLENQGPLFADPFDIANPVATPRGLTDDPQPQLEALARGVKRLEQAGIALDAAIGDAQFTKMGAAEIPIHGGRDFEGVANVVNYSSFHSALVPNMPRGTVIQPSSGLASDGYVISYGSSFVMAVELLENGPDAAALLTYGQSDDPDSTHFTDQTDLFRDKTWRPILFHEDDIESDPELRIERIAAPRLSTGASPPSWTPPSHGVRSRRSE